MTSDPANLSAELWLASNELAFAVPAPEPEGIGHVWIVPRRAVTGWPEVTEAERAAMFALADRVQAGVEGQPAPVGYTVRFELEPPPGAQAPRFHLELVPRFAADPDRSLTLGGRADPFIRRLRPLFGDATEVAIVAAFIQQSGLDRLRDLVEAAVDRGARVRILSGDYLNITQAGALEDLLDWMSAGPIDDEAWGEEPIDEGGERGSTDSVQDEDAAGSTDVGLPLGRIEARVIEVARLAGRHPTFHPKSWRFEGPGLAALFVGSSNISRAALETGVEWNLRVDRVADPRAYARAAEGFEALWASARVLDATWVAEYAARASRQMRPLPTGDAEATPIEPVPEPHPVQVEALEALRATREAGHRRGLVVLATGLGKTWLAAFDVDRLARELGRRPRVLFIAHRREILRQAARTFRRLARDRFPGATVTWFVGAGGSLDGHFVFASIQKLRRPQHLGGLDPRTFDYVVVDEVHHATAPSYRTVLDHLDPTFVLGLTATPERTDEADVLGLFDDNLVYRADLGVGIEEGRLVPFDYFGLKDDVDYQAIPWRNRRFDPVLLAAAVQTERRMARLWQAWAEHPGRRTVVFCASVAHANYVRDWLRARSLRVDAIHTGPGGDDREGALDRLAEGELDAVCSVDVLNEGVDVPSVDRVVMLRPTESPLVFLQQLGRGLRIFEGKRRLTVIDFVGNHRMFLDRIRRLLSLGGALGSDPVAYWLQALRPLELPSGCSVDVELEAKDLLGRLRPRGRQTLIEVYRELREERGARPTAGELQRMGYNVGVLRLETQFPTWFDFVNAEGDLAPRESEALESLRRFLVDVERLRVDAVPAILALSAMLEADALPSGLSRADLVHRVARLLERSPDLRALAVGPASKRSQGSEPKGGAEGSRAGLDSTTVDRAAEATAGWRRGASGSGGEPEVAEEADGIAEAGTRAWGRARNGRGWFRWEAERWVPAFELPPHLATAGAILVREIVDLRIARFRRRDGLPEGTEAFDAQVTWNQRDPILKLPSRGQRPESADGEVDVRLRNGDIWTFRLMKEFCNVARPAGTEVNQLPDLMRTWFGPRAGLPGTDFRVRFRPGPDGWWVDPLGERLDRPRVWMRTYPDLQAAAEGRASGPAAVEAAVEGPASSQADTVRLPSSVSGEDVFAVRAAEDSRDGDDPSFRAGDWVVMRFVQDEATATPDAIARVVEVIRPEDLGPPAGTLIPQADLAQAFGLDGPPTSGRHEGHLFILVDSKGALAAPDRLRAEISARPGETAFIVVRADSGDPWRYCGVGQPTGAPGEWTVPSLDHPLYKKLGSGRGASRTLSPAALARAEEVVEAIDRAIPVDGWIEARERRCRYRGRSPKGGLRIDGGTDGFKERTVSLVDLAWALIAADDVAAHGGVLDEARVNKLRYLEGTPKGATRWIDTGWALVLLGEAAVDPPA